VGGCGPWRERGRLQQIRTSIFEEFVNPPARPERGEVKYLILDAVAAGPIHGYEIMGVIEERTRGRYRPSAGTVYPTLQALEQVGLIASWQQNGRKIYEMTKAGREEVEGYGKEIADVYARMSSAPQVGESVELGIFEDHMNRIVGSVGRALHTGRLDDKRQDRIIEVIRDAARRIEQILRDR
jgi:DNA-binding PadR family transcriptional regulator